MTTELDLEFKLGVAMEALEWYEKFGSTTAINYDLGQRARKALKIISDKEKERKVMKP